MWHPLLDEAFFADASLTTIEKRVSDLRVAMRTFTGDGNMMTTYPNWKCILCHISYAGSVMDGITQVGLSFAPCCWRLTAFPGE